MARWRKQPSETGLARVCQGPRGFGLAEKGEVVRYVRPRLGGAMHREILGWYFTGGGHNSLWQEDGGLFATADEAKAAAAAHYKANGTK